MTGCVAIPPSAIRVMNLKRKMNILLKKVKATTRFALSAWTFVSMPTRFYAALERDIACGPTSTRAAVLVGD
jgi:hypothetical protein